MLVENLTSFFIYNKILTPDAEVKMNAAELILFAADVFIARILVFFQ